MPFVTVTTNIPSKNIPKNFDLKFSALISKVLTKPEDRVLVSLSPDTRMCRGGTHDAVVHVVMWSIAVFSKEKNPEYAKSFYQFLSENLGIPVTRITLEFHDLEVDQLPPPPPSLALPTSVLT